MFRATTNAHEDFQAWIKDSTLYAEMKPKSQSLVHKAFAHGWNSAVQSFLPKNVLKKDSDVLWKETNQEIKDFKGESDRTVAIVGMAFIDEALDLALFSAFVDEELARERISKFGYLAKCELVFALGFVSKKWLDDLKSLGEIRNKFAHKRKSKSFNDHEIKTRCLNLNMLKDIDNWKEADPRNRFITALAILSVYLTHRAGMEPQRIGYGDFT